MDFLGIECSLCLAVVAVGVILNEDTLRGRISICGVVWLGSLTFFWGFSCGWGEVSFSLQVYYGCCVT